MTEYDFWKNWENINEFEKNGIETLKKGRKIILDNIPRNETVSLYCKGSLARREMNKKSDVDIVVILKNTNNYEKIKPIEKKYKHEFNTELSYSPFTIYEFKTGRRLARKGSLNASTSRTIRHLAGYRLIYGKELDSSKFPTRPAQKELAGLIKAFEKYFLPEYEKGAPEFGFEMMVKQTLWLAENELWAKGITPKHTWKDIASHFPNKHIANLAWYYRTKPTKDPKLQKEFITKLRRYIKGLKRKYL